MEKQTVRVSRVEISRSAEAEGRSHADGRRASVVTNRTANTHARPNRSHSPELKRLHPGLDFNASSVPSPPSPACW